jgi:1,4-alpha-glucan branching enzyme
VILASPRVAVIGPFNGWRGNSHRLMRIPGGDWIITVFLPPGRVVYGFDVDGTCWPDPHGEDRVSAGSGSEYFIRHVGPGLNVSGTRSAPSTGRKAYFS